MRLLHLYEARDVTLHCIEICTVLLSKQVLHHLRSVGRG